MRAPLAFAGFLALAAIVACSDQGPGGRKPSPIDNGWPPARFTADVTPTSVAFIDRTAMGAACGGTVGSPVEIEACTRLGLAGDGRILRSDVTLPNPCEGFEGEDFARLACHELAHINGWPADHGR